MKNKILKFNFTKTNSFTEHLIKDQFTKIHNHYSHDGYNVIKTNAYERKRIVKREQEIFKKFKNYLNVYYKEWEKEVYSRTMLPMKDIGEKFGEYNYYNVTAKEGYDILMRKNKGVDEVVLDMKTIPFLKNINNTVLKNIRLPATHDKIAFVIDLENNEKYYGGIYDINTGKYYKNSFQNVSSIEFTKSDNVLYVENDSLNRPYRVKSHRLGDNFENDIVIYEEDNKNVYIETSPTKDGRYLIINSLTKDDSQISILDLNNISSKPVVLLKRSSGVKYFIEHSDDCFYILSNMNIKKKDRVNTDDNKDYKLFMLNDKDIKNPEKGIKLILFPEEECFFEDMDIFKDYLVIYLKKKSIPNILIHDIKTGINQYHSLKSPGELQPGLNKVIYHYNIIGIYQ